MSPAAICDLYSKFNYIVLIATLVSSYFIHPIKLIGYHEVLPEQVMAHNVTDFAHRRFWSLMRISCLCVVVLTILNEVCYKTY